MANDIKLQEGHPVDENLRPLKVGGETTAIETANYGNGARVNGDFEITGDTTAKIDLMKLGLVEAYSGMILGYTALGIDENKEEYAVTNSYVTITDEHKVSFVVPPSGNVEIELCVYMDVVSYAGRQLFFGLSTANNTDGYSTLDAQHEQEVWLPDETDSATVTVKWVVTGLTAGTQTTYWFGVKSTHSSTLKLRWGGDGTGEYSPFIAKATALPSTIYTGD